MKYWIGLLALALAAGCAKNYDGSSVLADDEVLIEIDGTRYTPADLPKQSRLDFDRIRYSTLSSLHRLSYRFADRKSVV